MKDIRLQALTLENFQGIKRLVLDLDGRSAIISARNRVGKSTIADAWSWLLVEKNSLGRSDFSLKPRDPKTGEDIHGLESSVEAVLITGESTSTRLKKTYAEDWTSRRGSATKQLAGHFIDRQIDGVSRKKRDWDDQLAEQFGAVDLNLLINPLYFASEKPYGLGWQDRRALIFAVCGDISDADVIASDQRF